MYINNLNTITQFDTLWNSDQLFVICKYSPRCSLCLSKMGDLYKRMSTSKVENIRFVDILNVLEVKLHIANSLSLKDKSPQIIIIQNKEIVRHRSETDINIKEISEVLVEKMLG